MAKVAFLGLGVMGFPMAGHLAAKGHQVTVYNRNPAKSETWVSNHVGERALTPAQAATGSEFVMACVGNDDDLSAICLGMMALLPVWLRAPFLSIIRLFRPK